MGSNPIPSAKESELSEIATSELIFLVEEAPEGGFLARAFGEAISPKPTTSPRYTRTSGTRFAPISARSRAEAFTASFVRDVVQARYRRQVGSLCAAIFLHLA